MTVSIELQMEQMGQRAKKAARVLSAAAPAAKTQALRALAALLIERQPDILKANALDVDAAKAANMDAPRLDRLTLTPRIMADMADACLHVAEMADEVGVIEQQWQRPNGLMIGKMRIPLGVIAMIFESRPNVTIDAAILCLKAGDAVILRGGSEAIHSNLALAGLLHEALRSAGLPEDAAQVVETTDRAAVAALCKLDKYVDVMIPRGGESLVRAVCEAATMPVLKHYMGVCHLYIDEGADLGMALRLAHNGKVQRPGVCNALECLLVHEKEAAAFLPMLAGKLGADGVEFRADARALPLLSGAKAVPAQPGDFGQEFHDLILAVRVVDSLDDALDLARQEAIPDDGLDRSEIWVIGGAKVFEEAMPFADKAYVTQISMHVNADTYAPDIHALVESGAWRVAEEGTWQKARKGNDQVEGFRFVTYERNHEE